MIKVVVDEADFDTGALLTELAQFGGGATSSFIGHVRGDDGLIALVLEHYPAMTQSSLQKLAEEAQKRWSLLGVTIHHRVGRMAVGEQIVLVGTASRHRADALDSCAFLIDRLKLDAPFWKQQIYDDGHASWVEERKTDLDAASKWDAAG